MWLWKAKGMVVGRERDNSLSLHGIAALSGCAWRKIFQSERNITEVISRQSLTPRSDCARSLAPAGVKGNSSG